MKNLFIILTILIVAVGCENQNNTKEADKIERDLLTKYNPFDDVITYDTTKLINDGFVPSDEIYGTKIFTMNYDKYELFVHVNTKRNSVETKGIEFPLDTILFDTNVINHNKEGRFFDEYAKRPFDTLRADKIMGLFNLNRHTSDTAEWLTYIDKNGQLFSLYFGYRVDYKKSEASRFLAYMHE